MSYMLRDRPDGQVEIILTKPILVGIFPERDIAQRVCTFLQDEAIDWHAEEPAGVADVAPADDLADPDEGEQASRALVEKTRIAPPPAPVRNLPVHVPEQPKQPPILTPAAPALTEDQKSAAFRRIVEGEKISAVAPDFGLTMHQLRGVWAAHKSWLQKHLAEGGQVACALCTRPFVPSISQPDTCARCSRE